MRGASIPERPSARYRHSESAASTGGLYYLCGPKTLVHRSNRTHYLPAVQRPNEDIAGFQSPFVLAGQPDYLVGGDPLGETSDLLIGRREQTKTAAPYTPLKGAGAVLKILEQYYIQTLRPASNIRDECVRFGPGGSITILEDGRPPLVLDGIGRFSTRRNASVPNMDSCCRAGVANFWRVPAVAELMDFIRFATSVRSLRMPMT